MFWRRRLTEADLHLLRAIAEGATLKSHRTIDGDKAYRLYPPEGEPREIPFDQVQRMLDGRLLTTNQKFPAATFLLTSRGQKAVARTVKRLKGVAGTVHFDT